MNAPSVKNFAIQRYKNGSMTSETDQLAVEEPLEIRLAFGPLPARQNKNLSITMRTPGHDTDLALGFLCTEGIVRQSEDIEQVQPLAHDPNVMVVSLKDNVSLDFQRLERHFYTTSSCGICGKTSIDAVKTTVVCVPNRPLFDLNPDIIQTLPARLREAQQVFEATGGLHASALFDPQGHLLALREDVGRHNALDKLIGHYFRQSALPLDQHILLLSGRASFELIQKAAMAGIQVVCAVGAPSSLAVETARSFGIRLVGFLKEGRFNVY
jgi:FdhD protein